MWLGSWVASQTLQRLRKRLRIYNWVWESVDLNEPRGVAEVAEVASFLRCAAGLVPKGEVQRRRRSVEALLSTASGGGSASNTPPKSSGSSGDWPGATTPSPVSSITYDWPLGEEVP